MFGRKLQGVCFYGFAQCCSPNAIPKYHRFSRSAYYFMMLVLDPDFSAEEIRTTKMANRVKHSGVDSSNTKRKEHKRKYQKMLGLVGQNVCAF